MDMTNINRSTIVASFRRNLTDKAYYTDGIAATFVGGLFNGDIDPPEPTASEPVLNSAINRQATRLAARSSRTDPLLTLLNLSAIRKWVAEDEHVINCKPMRLQSNYRGARGDLCIAGIV
jgi:hypothetical protein